MGAMAISTLAGAQLVANAAQAPLLEALAALPQGLHDPLLGHRTWWLPLLVALTAWRLPAAARSPARGCAGLEHGVPAGHVFGRHPQMDAALQLHLLAPLGSVFFGLALLAWVATALLRSTAWVRRARAATAA
jgi:hypothetical protein